MEIEDLVEELCATTTNLLGSVRDQTQQQTPTKRMEGPCASYRCLQLTMKCDRSIFQLQESMARDLENKLTKATEEFTSQVQSLKETISELVSEKVYQISFS